MLLWILLAAGLVWRLGTHGPTASTIAALLGVLLALPILLAAEFLLMSVANARQRARLAGAAATGSAELRVPQRPRRSALARAYGQELLAAVRVFAWQQPFCVARQPDTDGDPDTQGRGVVLIHGFACNRALWLTWLQRLRDQRRACIAVTLEPPWGPIERYVDAIEDAVRRVERRTGLPPVLVAHSMGGLAARTWWATTHPARIHRLITLGTPHQGTALASFALAANARQMRRGNAWLTVLADGDGRARRQRTSCFWSWCDNIVFPADTARLDGAANHELGDAGHVHMVFHPAPWAELQRWLVPLPAAGHAQAGAEAHGRAEAGREASR